MASPEIELRFNDEEVGRIILRSTADNAESAIRKTTRFIESSAVKKAPERTSNLVNSITSSSRGQGFDTEGTVKATAHYALFVEQGTGVFGPKGKPIFPKNAKALRWMAGGKAMFAKSILGMPARPFLKPAFDEEGPKLFELVFK